LLLEGLEGRQLMAGPTTYYVNDAFIVRDAWATAPGNDASDGLTPATPKASVSAILKAYDLNSGDRVRIDTGTYNLSENIFVGGDDEGNSTAPLTFEASAVPSRRCLRR
jgi:hypothetical protein